MWHQDPAAIGNGVVPPICLLLWQHHPQSFFGCIGLQLEWFVVVSEHQNGLSCTPVSNTSKAFMASSVSDTHSDFLLAPSLVRHSLRGCVMHTNPWWTSCSSPPDWEKGTPQCLSVVGNILELLLGLSCCGESGLLRLNKLGRWFCSWKVTLGWFQFQVMFSKLDKDDV